MSKKDDLLNLINGLLEELKKELAEDESLADSMTIGVDPPISVVQISAVRSQWYDSGCEWYGSGC